MVSEWMAPAIASTSNTGGRYLDGSPFDRNLLTILLLIGAVVLLLRGPRVSSILRANWPILLFFFYCLISIAWSDFPDVAFKRWVKALGDVVMVLVVLTDMNPSAAIKRLLARVGFVLIPVSVLFIKYYPEFGRAYETGFGYWQPMYTGVTTTKNLLGMVTLVAGLGALWRFIHMQRAEDGARRKGQFLAEGALLVMVFWLLYMSNSATSLSCFLMAGTLVLVTSWAWVRRMPALVHALVFAIVAVSSFAVFSNSGGGLLGTLGRNSTLTGRTDIWNQVLSMVESPFLGTGFESFWLGPRLQKIWNIWWWHPNEAHNGYIETYLNLGWMGLTLLGVVLVTGYRNIIATFRTKPDLAEIRLAYFLVAIVYNFTESAIRTMNPVWIVFLLSIMAVPDAPAQEEPHPLFIQRTVKPAEREPQFQPVARAGLRPQQESN
jgi:O-antigen ligase